MQECQTAVARDGGGTATVVVTRPDGRTRFVFYEKGKAIGADLSQANGGQHFRATKRGDFYNIDAGNERLDDLVALVAG